MNEIEFDEDYKKKLSEKLTKMAEDNELKIRKKLEEKGVDTSEIKIIDRAKFSVKYIPDVMEELFKKYGISEVLMDDPKIRYEARELVEKKFHEELDKQKRSKWRIYYILLHCKIYEELIIEENVKLIPFEGLSCNDYFEVVEKIFPGPLASELAERNLENGKKIIADLHREKIPLSLLIFENVDADSEIEVYENTKTYANDVTLSMSAPSNSSIEIGGWIIEGQLEGLKSIYPTIYRYHYNQTYVDVFEEITNRILKNIHENHLLKLALKYEKEAIAENEDEFRILKRWSALEYLAEKYDEINNENLLDADERKIIVKNINKILTDKGININSQIKEKINSSIAQINRKTAKEKVRNVLKAENYHIKEIDGDNDIIDKIYQYRNCITHYGGCKEEVEGIKEKCHGPRYCRDYTSCLDEINSELHQMILLIIGKCIDVKFKFYQEIPEHIRK
jgi:uncharacterized FlaG/YvyC family protein